MGRQGRRCMVGRLAGRRGNKCMAGRFAGRQARLGSHTDGRPDREAARLADTRIGRNTAPPVDCPSGSEDTPRLDLLRRRA
jgi:hypothetical protein